MYFQSFGKISIGIFKVAMVNYKITNLMGVKFNRYVMNEHTGS